MSKATTKRQKLERGIYRRGQRLVIAYDGPPSPETGRRSTVLWETLPAGTTLTGARKVRRDREVAVARRELGYAANTTTTLGEYLDGWIERFRAERPRTRTWYGWRSLFNKHLKPVAGGLRVSKLTTHAIRRAYQQIGAESPRIVPYVHTALVRALEDATRDGLLGHNVARGAYRAPRSDAGARASANCWSDEELRVWLAGAKNDERLGYAVWRTLAATGVRMGELLGLAPEDADLAHARLAIRGQYALADGKPTRRAPKTPSGRRSIDLDPATVAALRAYLHARKQRRLRAGARWHERGFLFCRDDGAPISPRAFAAAFDALVERAQVRRITPHGVRHTHATILLRQGRNPKYVADRLGHKDASILLDVYAHAFAQDGSEAARGFAAAIDG